MKKKLKSCWLVSSAFETLFREYVLPTFGETPIILSLMGSWLMFKYFLILLFPLPHFFIHCMEITFIMFHGFVSSLKEALHILWKTLWMLIYLFFKHDSFSIVVLIYRSIFLIDFLFVWTSFGIFFIVAKVFMFYIL